MPPNNEPFHRVKQGVQSMQGHRPRMSGLAGGLCVPSDTETLGEKKPASKGLTMVILPVGVRSLQNQGLTLSGQGFSVTVSKNAHEISPFHSDMNE